MAQVVSLDAVVNWGKSYSLWSYPFATACCGIEFMELLARTTILPVLALSVLFFPRQSDMILVLGTITYKMAPVLREIYDQLCEPKYVISVGAWLLLVECLILTESCKGRSLFTRRHLCSWLSSETRSYYGCIN